MAEVVLEKSKVVAEEKSKAREKGSTMKATKKRSGKLDNPLLKSTLHPSPPAPAPAERVEPEREPVSKKEKSAPRPSERAEATNVISLEEETASVLEIITDLENQLDAAFSIKDAQEQELATLKPQLEQAVLRTAGLEGKVASLEAALASQEELNSQLEFLEDAQLTGTEKIRSMEKEFKHKSAAITVLEQEARTHVAEIEARDTRIEQLELEIKSAGTTIMSLHDQISLLELEPAELADKLEGVETELRNTIVQRDKVARDLETSRASLSEIHLMLAETKTKSRKHYYKKRGETAK